jgi:hypothetical protein
MKSLLIGIKNVLLWSYARGTWQYDILCALIVLTLLFWPNGKASRLTSRTASAAKIVLAEANATSAAASNAPSSAQVMREHEIELKELQGFLQQQQKPELLNSPREAIVLYLQHEATRTVTVAAIEPFGDTQGRSGYRVRYRID